MAVRRWLRVAAVLGILPMFGCITIGGNQLDDVSPSAGALSPPVEQTVGDFSFHLDGGKMVTSNKMGRLLNDEILNRWQKSGFIAGHRYVKSSEFSDSSVYRVTLSGHQEGESSIFLQIISGLTLLVIPYYVDTEFDLRFSVENAETGCVFEARVTDSYNTIASLLFLPITFFAQGGARRTFDRIASNFYLQLAEQGAFDEHASCREADVPDVQGSSIADRLRELQQLKVDGLISDAEYRRKRDQIFDQL
jgi:hypothetical protein